MNAKTWMVAGLLMIAGCAGDVEGWWEVTGDVDALVEHDGFPPESIATTCLWFRQDGETQTWSRRNDGADLVTLPGAWEMLSDDPLMVAVGGQAWTLEPRRGGYDVGIDGVASLRLDDGCPLEW